MSRYYKKFCPICGDPVGEDEYTYCNKHADYSNRPDTLTKKYCTWCGRGMSIEDANDECEYCIDSEESQLKKIYELGEYYKALPERDTEGDIWQNCTSCGFNTYQRKVYTHTNRFIDLISLGLTTDSWDDGEYRCSNCGCINKYH